MWPAFNWFSLSQGAAQSRWVMRSDGSCPACGRWRARCWSRRACSRRNRDEPHLRGVHSLIFSPLEGLRFYEDQCLPDAPHQLSRALGDVKPQRLLRPLQDGELRIEQLWVHVVALARGEARADQFPVAVEKNEARPNAAAREPVAIDLFQRRAGEHQALALPFAVEQKSIAV